MVNIGAFEAKNTFSHLLERVLEGEEFLITRRGKAVARLIPATDSIDRQQAEMAALRIVKRSASIRRGGLDTAALRTMREGKS